MMWKPVLACLLSAALVAELTGSVSAPRANADREAIERTARDYVEALYLCKPELIERGVHPALQKIGLYRPEGQSAYRTPGQMTFDQLRDLAGVWNKEGKEGTDIPYTIEVLDALDVTASVKLVAKWGVDYMHLVKRDGQWKIQQILWQSHPAEK